MITQKQIAQQLNLSQSTVANILRGAKVPRYSEETRRAVQETAERLGYQPSRSAQAIRRGRSNLIGIIHFAGMLEIAQRVSTLLPPLITQSGYDFVLIDLRWHGGNVERVLNELIQARVEGVIICHMIESFGAQYTELFRRAGIPMISVFGNNRLNIPVVADDVGSGFAVLTRHLLSLGHQRLMLTTGMANVRPVVERTEGFREGMQGVAEVRDVDAFALLRSRKLRLWAKEGPQAVNLRIDLERYGHNERQAHFEIVCQLHQAGALPDALLCSNDSAAFGAFNAAHSCGLHVPEDLAVTGCDDDDFGKYPLFNLTTLRKDLVTICETAVQRLIAAIRKRTPIGESTFFGCELVLRRSCGRVPAVGEAEEETLSCPPICLLSQPGA